MNGYVARRARWGNRYVARRARWGWVVPVAMLLAVCLPAVCGRYLLDLDIYRAGGQAVRAGRDLYGYHVRRYSFTYPPCAGLAFSGYAWLTLAAASVVMTMLSVAGLLVLLRQSAPELVRRVRAAPTATTVAALSALAVCEPVRSTIWNGQVNLVLGALVMIDLLVLRRGVLVGVAAAVKLTPGVFILFLLVSGRLREACNAVLVFVLVAAAGAVALPGDSWRFWTRVLWSGSGIGDVSRPENQSLRGALDRLLGASAAGPVWAVAAVSALVVGLALARRAARAGQQVLAIGTVGVTGCLVSPVSWTHHWIWCVPWLVGLWGAAAGGGRWARTGVVALGVLFLVQGPPLFTGPVHGHWARIIGTGYVPAVLMCWAVTCVRGWAVGRRSRGGLLALDRGECQTRVGTRLP